MKNLITVGICMLMQIIGLTTACYRGRWQDVGFILIMVFIVVAMAAYAAVKQDYQ